jgi:hypothetical protein
LTEDDFLSQGRASDEARQATRELSSQIGGSDRPILISDQPVNTSGDPQPGRAIQLGGKFYF